MNDTFARRIADALERIADSLELIQDVTRDGDLKVDLQTSTATIRTESGDPIIVKRDDE